MDKELKGRGKPSVVALAAVVVFLLFFWQAFAYFGFVGGLAEWQFGEVGTYFPALTQTVLVGLCALLVWLVSLLLRKRRTEKDTLVGVQEEVQRYLSTQARITKGLYILVALGLLGAIISALLLFSLPGSGGPAQRLSSTTAMAPMPREGLTVLRGPADMDQLARFRETILIRERTTYFVPLGSGGAKAPVQYFVQVRRIEGNPERYVPIRAGILRKGGLPRELRAMYDNAGLNVVDDHFVLFESASSLGWRHETIALEFLLFSLVCAVFAFLHRRNWRRTEAALADSAIYS